MKNLKTKLASLIASPARGLCVLAAALSLPLASHAAGVLTPVGSGHAPIQLQSHHVQVVINNGFAHTQVEQTFVNPNAFDLEARYTTPVPEHGALSELTIWAGETVLQGEVVAKADADRIYEAEKQAGNDVGKAAQNAYQNFEFAVSKVPASGSVRMRYAYYEPLSIDTGVGRYTYPLEEGGTDEAANGFWSVGDQVTTDFQIEVVLKSAYPIAKTRTPQFSGTHAVSEEGYHTFNYASQGGSLAQDFVYYYMLGENLPGRMEMLTHKAGEDQPGTFMMVMTPGVDLKPLDSGADFVFALDVSGSMRTKLSTLVSGVKKAIGQLDPADRFRIVAFNNQAWDVTGGWTAATPDGLDQALRQLDGLASTGGTNVYDGVRLSLQDTDADRVTSLILVTDGVTNSGIVDPKAFYKLMHRQDVRFYGFLLGNGSNWPLMNLMCDASGGRYRAVSNAHDIIGEVLIAKNKIAFEAMRNAELRIKGITTSDVSDFKIGKIHHGDQLILFGRYEEGGDADVVLTARVNGEDREYRTRIHFPDLDESHPELERMWALDQVRKIETSRQAGFLQDAEAAHATRDLGIAYQIVTDETTMIALDDGGRERHGVGTRNRDRLENEAAARLAHPQSTGARRVDTSAPMYDRPAPRIGSGGGGAGAVTPWMVILVLAGGAFVVLRLRKAKAPIAGTSLGLLALVAAGSQTELSASSATDRSEPLATGNASSIDSSISQFWSVSESEARVVSAPSPAATSRPAVASPVATVPDRHELDQRRDKHSRRGHFGINLFNKIPIIDLVWGEDRQDETDRVQAKVRR